MMEKKLLNSEDIQDMIKKMSDEIINHNKEVLDNLIIVGLRTRGVYLAQRISNEIKKITKKNIPVGILDITLYRDDVNKIGHQPIIKETSIPCDLTDRNVILVDDVLFTGRSIRAAIDEIMDFGRPRKIELAVLIDRGHRELPIQPDYVGEKIPTRMNEKIQVKLKEIDNKEEVIKIS